MPQEEPPHLFGFHPNADISQNISQQNVLLNLMLKIGEIEGVQSLKDQLVVDELNLLDSPGRGGLSSRIASPRSGGGFGAAASDYHSIASEKENALATLCRDIKKKLPSEKFDLEDVGVAFEVHKDKPLNTIVKQETQRYNNLYNKIIDTINNILLAQKGEATLTDELANCMD